MVEWLAGNRIRGTTAEKPVLGLPSGSVGGWVELGRTTLGSTTTDLDVLGFADKRYYMVLGNLLHNGSQDVTMRCGQSSTLDIDSNYASRRNENGGSDVISVSRPNMILADIQSSTQSFGVNYFSNKSTKEKLQLGHMVYQGTAGAGNAPARTETVNKWVNISNALDSLSYDQGSWLSGSEVVVLGWDPTDTHTTNFWEELASADWSSGYQINSGTFTAKKYLWIQGWYKNAANTSYARFRVGNNTIDDANNYANRYSLNGAGDNYAGVTTDHIKMNVTNTDASSGLGFFNMFIINNASNEKLVIGHHTLTASGAGYAPARNEFVAKWYDISNQINVVELYRYGGNNFTAGGIKVWGSN